MILERHSADSIVVESPTCGEGLEILHAPDYGPFSVAMFTDIRPTIPHFHRTFDETYLVVEGTVKLRLFDPGTLEEREVVLERNELCVIGKGTHHGVLEATPGNRVCVLAAPPFHPDDETPSDHWPT